jgi:hypothetical protein
MNKKMIYALVLIGLSVVVLLVNMGGMDRISIDLIFTTVKAAKSMLLLAAIALGVVIGVLLK